jgi:hypothetical protein
MLGKVFLSMESNGSYKQGHFARRITLLLHYHNAPAQPVVFEKLTWVVATILRLITSWEDYWYIHIHHGSGSIGHSRLCIVLVIFLNCQLSIRLGRKIGGGGGDQETPLYAT